MSSEVEHSHEQKAGRHTPLSHAGSPLLKFYFFFFLISGLNFNSNLKSDAIHWQQFPGLCVMIHIFMLGTNDVFPGKTPALHSFLK